jgi:hypothetical protein
MVISGYFWPYRSCPSFLPGWLGWGIGLGHTTLLANLHARMLWMCAVSLRDKAKPGSRKSAAAACGRIGKSRCRVSEHIAKSQPDRHLMANTQRKAHIHCQLGNYDCTERIVGRSVIRHRRLAARAAGARGRGCQGRRSEGRRRPMLWRYSVARVVDRE